MYLKFLITIWTVACVEVCASGNWYMWHFLQLVNFSMLQSSFLTNVFTQLSYAEVLLNSDSASVYSLWVSVISITKQKIVCTAKYLCNLFFYHWFWYVNKVLTKSYVLQHTIRHWRMQLLHWTKLLSLLTPLIVSFCEQFSVCTELYRSSKDCFVYGMVEWYVHGAGTSTTVCRPLYAFVLDSLLDLVSCLMMRLETNLLWWMQARWCWILFEVVLAQSLLADLALSSL
jgi:hypothetical protein